MKQKQVLRAKGGGSLKLKKVETSLSIEHKEQIQDIYHKSMDLLISSILNNNNMAILASEVNCPLLMARKSGEGATH